MSKTIYIGGRLESKEKGNVVTGANAILDDTKGKKQNVINKETDDELTRLEQSKQDNLNFDNAPTEDSTNPVTSGGVYTAEKALSNAIEAILLLIPSAATALNKLVDTNTMNSSISTATATFRGTYNAVSDLGLTYQATHAQIEAALDALGLTADNNDFVFVQIPVSDQSQDIAKTERFKFNGTNWLYEYDLNTSGFTAAQWAAINSGITVALVTKLTDLPTAAALQLALNGKQDTLTFDNEPTALSQNPVTSGGIYTAIQAVATALSDYSTTTDGRLNVLEGLIPMEASSSNKLTDKAYVDGLIQAITELIPAEADTTNQLADKAYVLAQILAATPAFKGQFVTLAELQAVASPKAGDLGIVRTKDSDGMDVFTVYQYLSNAWNVFYSLSYHPQTKPATTGTTGDYPYNGMGRVELAKNMVNTGTDLEPTMVNQLTQDMFYKGAVGSRVPNTNTIFVIRYDYVLAENITIPDGCVLQFDGGSISGAYTLTFSNTLLNGKPNFDLSCILTGSIQNKEIYVEWFGAIGDGTYDENTGFVGTDNRQAFINISSIINSSKGGTVIFGNGKTYASSVERFLNIGEFTDIQDCSVLYFDNIDYVCVEMNNSTIAMMTNANNSYRLITFSYCSKSIIRNGYLIGDGRNHSYVSYHPDNNPSETYTSYEWCYGIGHGGGELLVSNMNISHCCGDAVIAGSYNDWNVGKSRGILAGSFKIENCELSYCGRQGISAHSTEYTIIENCKIHHIGTYLTNPGFSPMSGIDFEYEDQANILGNVVVRGCYIHDTTSGSIVSGKSGSDESQVIGFTLDDCLLNGGLLLNHITANGGVVMLKDSTITFLSTSGNRVYGDVIDNCELRTSNNLSICYISCAEIKNSMLINENSAGVTTVSFLSESNFYNCIIKGFKSTDTSSGKFKCFNGFTTGQKLKANFYDTEIIDTDIAIGEGSASQVSEKNVYKNVSFKNCHISTGISAYFYHCTFEDCQSAQVTNQTEIVFSHCRMINKTNLVSELANTPYPLAINSLYSPAKYTFCEIYTKVQAIIAGQSWDTAITGDYKRCIFHYDSSTACRTTYPNMTDCTKIGIS